jgi:hypothetical protein
MEHFLKADSSSVPEPAGTPTVTHLETGPHRNGCEYRWQSTAAMRLAVLHQLVRDLRECNECLRLVAQQPADRFSRFLIFAALACYRRAGDGELSQVLEASQHVLSIGAGAFHQKLMRLAHDLLVRAPDPANEPTIGIIVRDNQIVDVLCHPQRADTHVLSVSEVISHIDLIERQIIRPEIARSKARVLNEAQTLGIQLVRHLPAVEGRSA